VWKLEQHATTYALLLSAVTLALDYVTGPHIRFPIMFALPVVMASWYRRGPLGMCLALFLSAARLGLAWHWDPLTPWTMTEDMVHFLIHLVVLGTLAYLTATAAQERRALQEQVRVLRGILPICSFCKKIRDREGQWQVLEAYITHYSEAEFSHGVWPSCAQEHYGDYLKPKDGPLQTR
jgi:hypothetical protein